MKARILIAAVVLASTALPAPAKMAPSDATRKRQEAEHLCYDDVQKLCNDAIPDEDKIKACMQVHHAQLSAPCAKVYDEGIDG